MAPRMSETFQSTPGESLTLMGHFLRADAVFCNCIFCLFLQYTGGMYDFQTLS